MSCHTTPISFEDDVSEASGTPFASTVIDPFARMMAPNLEASEMSPTTFTLRDLCYRSTPIYNTNYNPFEPARDDLKADYSPYSLGEPLFDDRPVKVANLPKGYILSPALSMLNRSWLWKLGYTLIQLARNKKHTFWLCKLCMLLLLICFLMLMYLGHHDARFAKNKTTLFNSNSLKNLARHMLQEHKLEQGGDIGRLPSMAEPPALASGVVGSNYEEIIPFRQLEFRNAFTKWVIMDNVKHRKAASINLRRMFKIANIQALNALPTSHSTSETWVTKMFQYFEPQIIADVAEAQSKISLSFDGWGSKREKISVVALVLHYVNKRGEVVIVLAGLLELLGHRKSGVGTGILLNLTLFLADFIRSSYCASPSTATIWNQRAQPWLVCP